MAAVVAGLFVVVGLAAVLSTQGGPDDGGFAEIAADTAENGPSEDRADRDAGADDSDGQLFEDSAETTVAAAESEPAADALSDEYFSEEALAVRSGEFTPHAQSYDEGSDGEVDICLERAGLEEHVAVAILTPPPEETGDAESELLLVAAVPESSRLAEAPVAFVDLASCRIIHVES